MRNGINGGLYLDMEILPNLAPSYELLWMSKGFREQITIVSLDGEALAHPAVLNASYSLDYMEVPILLKVKVVDNKHLRLNFFRPMKRITDII